MGITRYEASIYLGEEAEGERLTDFLLVHGAGQGAWAWGHVWGYLTAPQEHPPRLYVPRRVNVAYALDLPGHGADAGGDTAEVRPEECVHSILRAVEREGLRDLVMVGHGAVGGLVLRAAGELGQPPKRVVLVAGIVPDAQESILSALPSRVRGRFRLLSLLSKLFRQELKLPPSVIQNCLCNGMQPMDVVHSLGFFGLLPTRVLTDRMMMDAAGLSCPVTYVVLGQDRLVPVETQERMAARIPGAETVFLDSCHQAMLSRPRELADILLQYA